MSDARYDMKPYIHIYTYTYIYICIYMFMRETTSFFLPLSLSLSLCIHGDYIQRVEIAYIDERHNSSCVFSLPFSRAVDKHIYIYLCVCFCM